MKFLVACLAVLSALPLRAADDPPVVPKLDFQRFAGVWYEIARLPNRFEKDCARDVTATYSSKPDGRINVVNACTQANGKRKESKGTARVADKDWPDSKLKVTFFWPFSGDYWVLDLDADYQWALVGGPDRKYLWILSRKPHLNTQTYDQIVSKAKALDFDTSQLLRVTHSK